MWHLSYKESFGFCMSEIKRWVRNRANNEWFESVLSAELVKHVQETMFAGFNLSFVGDNNDYSIAESKYADTLTDKVIKNALKYYADGNDKDQSIELIDRFGEY